MKMMNEIFSGTWSEALAWTLIHSLWLGLVISIALVTALRFIPGRNSSTRYIAASVALTLFVISSVTTFILLYDVTVYSLSDTSTDQVAAVLSSTAHPAPEDFVSLFSTALYSFVESNLYLITIVWMVGTFLFSLRMVSGFLYVSVIRKNAASVQEEWMLLVQQLAERIGLNKRVALAESSNIKVPFVVGFFRPIILFPVGMMSGLSMQQAEAILVHELMHIKRNDYVVNIVQSIVESIFFFNPFVWVISSLIRKEREHCCDDEVVKYGDPISYAHALTRIEELNLKHISPALSLAENKNQLLKRIKRIMEKSVQNYSVKERIVPVVLLLVGLICASWFSIRPAGSVAVDETPLIMAGDTTKPKESPKTYSKRKITVTDREGNPVEVIEVETNEELEADQEYDFSFNYDFAPPVPPVPSVEPVEPFEPPVPMAPFEPMQPMQPMQPIGADVMFAPPFPFALNNDTIPGLFFRNNDDWEAFSEDFQSKFKEKFSDFYKKHGEEMDKMMKEMGENFKTSFDKGLFEEMQREAEHAQELSARHMEAARGAMQRNHFRQEQALMAEQRARHAQGRVQEHHEMLKQHEKELQRHREELKVRTDRMKKFEKELKEELIKDGYLGKDESISNMHWKDNEKIEINGKEIKKEHQQKYHDLHRKYFQRGGSFIYVD
jgi:bla regulator protein BlaR1